MMRGGGGAARCKHGDRASVITGLPEHSLGSIAACSARNKNVEDTVLWRLPRSSVPQLWFGLVRGVPVLLAC